MAKKDDKPGFEKPASLLDLEERLENGNVSPRGNYASSTEDDDEARDYSLGNDQKNYLGVSPEYQGWDQPADKPHAASGAEGEVEKRVREVLEGNRVKAPSELKKERDKEAKSSSSSSSSSPKTTSPPKSGD